MATKSEEQVWEELLEQSAAILKRLRALWKKERSVPRMLIGWPRRPVVSDDGDIILHRVSFAVPDGMTMRKAAQMLAEKIDPCALLGVEQKAGEVRMSLESHHGAKTWVIPIRRHGDVDVLEKERTAKDSEGIGVLWRPLSMLN